MDPLFYLIDVRGLDSPGLPDIIDKFNQLHSERGSPVGDSLDCQMDSILAEVCLHFNIECVSTLDNAHFFFPTGIDANDVIKMLENNLDEDD